MPTLPILPILQGRMSLSHKHLPDMMIPLNIRSVESLDIHRKITGTIIACLQISEEEIAAKKEVM